MIAAFFGLSLSNIFLRSSMGVLAPELSAELALSPAMLGATASAFFVSYALMQLPTGLLLDRYGPRLTVIGLFLLTVIGTFLFAISWSGPMLLTSRLIMGIGCAGVFSGAFMIIARFYSADRLTSIGGTMNSFAMLGTLLATAPLAALVTTVGWRVSFIGFAFIAAAIALLAALTVQDRPQKVSERRESVRDILAGSWEVIRTPGVLPIASGGIALSAGNTLLGIWGGPYLNDVYGLDEIARGKVLVFMACGGVFGHFVFGHLARWLNTLKWLIICGSLVIATILGTLAVLTKPSIAVVSGLLALLGVACSFPTILLAHARAMVPDRLIGRGISTVNTGIMIAIAIMQIAVGALIGALTPAGTEGATPEAYRAAFAFIAVMAVISAGIYTQAPDRPPHAKR